MKNYLDIEQCNSIIQTLSPDTADMHYDIAKSMIHPINGKYCKFINTEVPCWSTGALLNILSQQATKDKRVVLIRKDINWTISYINNATESDKVNEECTVADNVTDALYDMLMKVLPSPKALNTKVL